MDMITLIGAMVGDLYALGEEENAALVPSDRSTNGAAGIFSSVCNLLLDFVLA